MYVIFSRTTHADLMFYKKITLRHPESVTRWHVQFSTGQASLERFSQGQNFGKRISPGTWNSHRVIENSNLRFDRTHKIFWFSTSFFFKSFFISNLDRVRPYVNQSISVRFLKKKTEKGSSQEIFIGWKLISIKHTI